jgi:two-component system sensor histidine kinase UhpB
MRRFATELFSGSPIELSLDLPAIEAHAEALDPHSRRQIYLIFKEALRNALRHSGARRVEVSLRSEGSRMTLTIQDDGRGLDLGDTDRGHGLASIRRRAQAIGAELAIAPSPQGGVRLVLESGPRALSGPPSE